MPVAIITDSTSDIEPARAAELGIDVVPLFVLWGDRSYRDYVDLTRRQFYEKFTAETVLPTTSQPTAKMFEDAFAPHAAKGDEIICITVSAKLSGTINAARTAAQALPQARITVVDSQSVAGGLGMQALHARELANAGSSAAEILTALEGERRTQRLYACIPDLSHVVRTGRIGKARAVIGSLMKIVPVISLKDGEVVAVAQVRTFSRALETMLQLATQSITDPNDARFLVMHTNAPDLARDVLERLQSQLGNAKPKLLSILEAGPVIATHGGPGAVGIFSAQN